MTKACVRALLRRAHCGLWLGMMMSGLAAVATAQEWKPERNIELVVSSGAGGAADRSARTIQKFLQEIPGMTSVVVNNKPGGSGTVAWSYVNQHPGDGHYISTLNTALVTNQIIGLSTLRYQDITPLNILMHEYVAVWVRSGSTLMSGKDLVAKLKADPASVSFGISPARGNQNHIVLGMIARSAGIDPKALKIVVYSSGGAGATAALGGHVEVWTGTVGNALPLVQDGRIRVLGISAPQRQAGGFAAVPTFREQGIDAVYSAWRGFLAPGGLSPAQVAYWDRAFSRIVEDPDWKAELEKNAWGREFKGSAETRKFLEAEHKLLDRILADLGLIKR
ncbi:MAG: tripartite tricarboxylate transporter substrate binding protein [Burkholderiales bacterium]|nr:tripartite tricarboxylate transporter substrate binding protein [Burkholderiales bacterium]